MGWPVLDRLVACKVGMVRLSADGDPNVQQVKDRLERSRLVICQLVIGYRDRDPLEVAKVMAIHWTAVQRTYRRGMPALT